MSLDGRPHVPYAARVTNHAMATAPASASKASRTPATIAHSPDRFVAHHMNRDAAIAQMLDTARTRIVVFIVTAALYRELNWR